MTAYFVIGGGWAFTASYLRASFRLRIVPSSPRNRYLGFRLVRSKR
jgi:formylglycine-generating enzyme required for sulfatase activity